METLGTFLRATRNRKGLTLRDLAARARVSAAFLSDLELGRKAAKESTLTRIAQGLGISSRKLSALAKQHRIEALRSELEAMEKAS